MKLVALIKSVPDTEAKIKLNADASGIDTAGVKFVMNPYDEYGVEQALLLKEASGDATVTVIALGPHSTGHGGRRGSARGRRGHRRRRFTR